MWQTVKWKGYAPKSELKRIVRHLGKHTRYIQIEGGHRFHFGDNNENDICISGVTKQTKRSPGKRIKLRKGNNALIDITDSLLRSIQLNCTNLEFISFLSCKIDYFSRYVYKIKNIMFHLSKITIHRLKFDNCEAASNVLLLILGHFKETYQGA